MATHAYDFRMEPSSFVSMDSENLPEHLESLESFLFDPVTRRDISAVSNLLADDFCEFGSSGRIYSKLDILAELSTEQPVVITLTDFHCQRVAADVALVTYKSLSSQENRMPTQALRSSLWVLRPLSSKFAGESDEEPRWQMLFHQGTRV